ncbi:superoxide dismutase family protein [Streptomyces sp. NPDC056039]|uniref:superoxide dismutase family protein n=1 Tax=Streptomyces sp. NPDC056039 TaxID=3345687 RepID=UPI0035D71F81
MLAGICASAVAAALSAAGPGGAGAVEGHVEGYSVRAEARFVAAGAAQGSAALTYDRGLVPVGSWIQVRQHTVPGGGTTVRLKVAGMKPGHAYGVHVHQKPCGVDPEAAGGHYQHRPSSDPHHVSPDNEVWLDFTADRRGAGAASARHEWGFRPGEASSVVIHDVPGGAGERAACFTVPFEPVDRAEE